MAGIECDIGKPVLKPDYLPAGDVTGFITMESSKATGLMAISFSSGAIFEIVEKMVGDKVNSIDTTVVDMVGELTNMTTGGAKNLLTQQGYDFNMATPEIFTGKEQEIPHHPDDKIITVPFSIQSGSFYVELSFKDT